MKKISKGDKRWACVQLIKDLAPEVSDDAIKNLKIKQKYCEDLAIYEEVTDAGVSYYYRENDNFTYHTIEEIILEDILDDIEEQYHLNKTEECLLQKMNMEMPYFIKNKCVSANVYADFDKIRGFFLLKHKQNYAESEDSVYTRILNALLA